MQDDTGIYTYTWTIPATLQINKTFDIYLSWKYTATGWSDWQYAGTTTENTFSFSEPATDVQYVQAAVFLSSNPKLTNIYGEQAERTFVSISPAYSTYYDAGGNLGTVTGSGPYFSTISGLSNVPSGINGRRIFATGSRWGSGAVTVQSTDTAADTIRVSSTALLTAGAITDIRL